MDAWQVHPDRTPKHLLRSRRKWLTQQMIKQMIRPQKQHLMLMTMLYALSAPNLSNITPYLSVIIVHAMYAVSDFVLCTRSWNVLSARYCSHLDTMYTIASIVIIGTPTSGDLYIFPGCLLVFVHAGDAPL